jgi:hypothetical protein
MRTLIITATVASFRLPIRYSGRKRGKLLFQLIAAAIYALFICRLAGTFQKFTYPAAFTALIFIDWHTINPYKF